LASDGQWYPPRGGAPVAAGGVGSRSIITGALVAAIVVGVVGLGLILRTSTTPSVAPTAPIIATLSPSKALLERTIANADRQVWVHMAGSVTQGTTSYTITGDAGPTTGQGQITTGGNTVIEICVNGLDYVHITSASVASLVGVKSINASTVGQWISFRPQDPGFSTISSGMTLHEAIAQDLAFPGTLVEGKATTVDGQQVIPLLGQTEVKGHLVKATLDVTKATPSLPVEINASGAGTSATLIFSAWGKVPTITAPAGAKPVSSL
jgi:hypothetical protein